MPVNPATDFIFFNAEVNNPAMIIITHCPNANKKNKAIDVPILADNEANAIMLARIGEEQGVEASANTIPISTGNMNILFELFWGIFLIKVGKLS